jgi:transposase-like protein
MVVEPIHRPACQGTEVVNHGKTSDGTQRFRCQHDMCPRVTFPREYGYQGCSPAVTRPMIAMSLHASGRRDSARVLQSRPTPVRQE